jgi:hypothetical protein
MLWLKKPPAMLVRIKGLQLNSHLRSEATKLTIFISGKYANCAKFAVHRLRGR